ncbi:hypothetical protein [Rheinheimera gaetbuli]
MGNLLRLLAGIILGIFIPVFLLFNVIENINNLQNSVKNDNSDNIINSFRDVKPLLNTANDYALYSVIIAEQANQKTMINKQVMKVAVIQIGFSVISIGLLFVVLGFNDGGFEAFGSGAGFSFDVKTGASGLAAIIIGASMSTLGGVLKNEYWTVKPPDYIVEYSMPASESILKNCKKIFINLPKDDFPEKVSVCVHGQTLNLLKKEYIND